MMDPALILLGGALCWLTYVFAAYPAILRLLGLRHLFRHVAREDYLPTLSVLISARNEEKDIGWKVAETLTWDYPADRLELLVASDASEDHTDEILRGIADPRLRYLRIEPRVGKNEALNRLSRLASGEVFVFTDANSHISGGSLRALVRHFADARVGCVTGLEQTIPEERDHALSAAAGAYLGYEHYINTLEGRLGSVLVCDGSFFAVRRRLFTPLRPDLANDLELPIRVGAQGYAVLFEPAARSLERATRSPWEEFNRRRRICGQGILGFWRLWRLLRGLRAWQLVSRKLLRWLTAVPLALLLGCSVRLAQGPTFAIFAALLAVFLGLALAGWIRAACGQGAGRLVSIPFYVLLSSVAALVGVTETCLGRRYAVWEIPSHSRGEKLIPKEGSAT